MYWTPLSITALAISSPDGSLTLPSHRENKLAFLPFITLRKYCKACLTLTDPRDKEDKIRIDKWLWAARFFKTRTLAKTAIEGGKVQASGQRIKVSKEIVTGDILRIRQGWDEREIVVKAISDVRRSAPIAQALYEETAGSLERRARAAEARKAAGALARPSQKPGKHERKALERLRKQFDAP